MTAADLAQQFGYSSLADELRLNAKPAVIQVESATVVRLVIKKRNVPRSDAANQVNEQDFSSKNHLNLNFYYCKITIDTYEQSSDKHPSWNKKNHETTDNFEEETQ